MERRVNSGMLLRWVHDYCISSEVLFTCLIILQERYMREYQRRLSVFESVPGTGSIVCTLTCHELGMYCVMNLSLFKF